MSIGEYINHYNGVRVRTLGSGNLKLRLLGLPDEARNQITQELTPIVIGSKRIITTLANMNEQAAQLEVEVTELDEHFLINRIIIYKLPTNTSYPG